MARAVSKFAPKLAIGAGALLLAIALPTSVVAVGLIDGDAAYSDLGGAVSFTPASTDPRLAELVAKRSGGNIPLMRFTPASSNAERTNRSVTVAVRVDQQIAQALSGRSSVEAVRDSTSVVSGLRIAPSRYNLGVARGYRSFAQAPAATTALSSSLSNADIPDLADFRPSAGAAEKPSRFAARIELEKQVAAASQSGDAVERLSDQMLDVGGSYSLTRNLNVTAGVRYRQDRDLRPLPDIEQQDSQAVYIGTQFRF